MSDLPDEGDPSVEPQNEMSPLGGQAGSVKPEPAAPTVPAGWYPDPDTATGYRYGSVPSLRYFDGVRWTEDRAPMQRNQQRTHYPPQQPIFVQQNVVAPPVVVNNGSSSMVGLHIVLTILTCGFWLPVWVLIEIIQAATKR